MKMRFLILTVLSLFAFSAMAEESLTEMKSMARNHITEKMTTLRTSQDCISNAATKDAFKACKYDMHESMKAQKQEMMEEKKAND